MAKSKEFNSRRRFDTKLIEVVESGAAIVMNDADWAQIRRAARGAHHTTRRKPPRKR